MTAARRILCRNGGLEKLKECFAYSVGRGSHVLELEYLGLAQYGVAELVQLTLQRQDGERVAGCRTVSFEVVGQTWTPYVWLDEPAGRLLFVYSEHPRANLLLINVELQRRLIEMAGKLDAELERLGFAEDGEQYQLFPACRLDADAAAERRPASG